jgi:3'-phosphoadenosine 5'-phosphosulfate sulfotransferase (PAPS reductase)/FAD synthetase
MATTRQTSFATPDEKARDILRRAAGVDADTTAIAVSGGTDSIYAAWLAATIGPEVGVEPDVVVHANTGAAIPQTRLVAKVIAEIVDARFVDANNGTLGPRVLSRGWPAGTIQGHYFEFIERKSDVFDELYHELEGEQLWISGARATESKRRSGNVPDSGLESDSRRAKLTWCSPAAGATSSEKWDAIVDERLPVSESYLLLGMSGECVACSFDDAGLLTDLDILAPNLSWALRCLTAWLALRAKRGDVDITPKQLCWGWDPETNDTQTTDQQTIDGEQTEQDWVGCGGSSCGERDIPDRVRDLEPSQIVDRSDVLEHWETGSLDHITERFEPASGNAPSRPDSRGQE